MWMEEKLEEVRNIGEDIYKEIKFIM